MRQGFGGAAPNKLEVQGVVPVERKAQVTGRSRGRKLVRYYAQWGYALLGSQLYFVVRDCVVGFPPRKERTQNTWVRGYRERRYR